MIFFSKGFVYSWNWRFESRHQEHGFSRRVLNSIFEMSGKWNSDMFLSSWIWCKLCDGILKMSEIFL